MKLKIRVIFRFLLSVMALIAIGLFVGSIDSSTYDDLGLPDQIKDVQEAENGFSEISYTQEEDFSLFASGDSSEELRQHIYYEKWDDDFANNIIAEGAEHIENGISSLRYPYFKFPVSKDVGDLPSYISVMDIHRLLILKSMYSAKSGDTSQALELAKHSAIFSQKIKTESNNWLISHMIGLVLQHEALLWLHHLATEYDLSSEQYTQLLAIFDHIPAYRQDSFSQVFSGEFVFVRNMVDMDIDRPFKERWQDYWGREDWWNAAIDDDFSYGDQTVQEKLFNFLEMLFPKYYLHKNSVLGELAKYYLMLSKESLKNCNEVNITESEYGYEVEWLDLVKPNAVSDQWADNISTFRGYYSRRCFGHAHIESVKSTVAIMHYKRNTGSFPDTLAVLVPTYLPTIPVDPFDGKQLRYTRENEYLYAVGTNFQDNGGSLDALYVRRCEDDDKCAQNPTFPILPKMLLKIENNSKNADYDKPSQ